MSSRVLASLSSSLLLAGAAVAEPDAWQLDAVVSNGVRVADYALAHPTRANHRDWTYGVFYAGLAAFGLAHPEMPYLDLLRGEGTNYSWRLDGGRPFYAETHCIGQTWLELSGRDDSPAALDGTRGVLDYVLENRSRAPVVQRVANGGFSSNSQRWSWSDALFMAPPVWAKMAALTGADRYRDYMIGEYRATVARLFDREHHLFYRDFPARDRRSANDAKVFWGRGNGWALGGLPLVIRELPPDLKSRPFFVDLFREMCGKVKTLQREDGSWSPSLLDGQDPDLPEMSATSLFCFALMWGVNEGILPEAEYLPVVKRAWSAMCRNVSFEGTFGWVQQAATGPTKDYGPDSTALYAVGGYLLAATEIGKHLVLSEHRDAKRIVVGPVPRHSVATVSVSLAELPPLLGNWALFDTRDAAEVPCQLWDESGDGVPDALLFRTSLLAGVPREFRILYGRGTGGPKFENVPAEDEPMTGMAFLREGRTFTSEAQATRKVVACGPVRTVVSYDLPAVECGGGVTVKEVRTVTRDRGSRFAVCRSTFTFTGAEDLIGGPVLSVADGELWARPDRGWASVADSSTNRLAAVCVRNPVSLQTIRTGEVALTSHLRSEQTVTWLVGEDVLSRSAFADHAQWRDGLERALEDSVLTLPVKIK